MNSNPVDWGDNLVFDQEFQDEFNKVVSNPSLPEADELFPPMCLTIATSTWNWRCHEAVVGE
jgi:hypothetical protein